MNKQEVAKQLKLKTVELSWWIGLLNILDEPSETPEWVEKEGAITNKDIDDVMTKVTFEKKEDGQL